MKPSPRLAGEGDPVTMSALIFRIIDDPSRTLCALALSCPPLMAILMLTHGGLTLWVGAGGGLVSIPVLIRLATRRKRAVSIDTGDDATRHVEDPDEPDPCRRHVKTDPGVASEF